MKLILAATSLAGLFLLCSCAAQPLGDSNADEKSRDALPAPFSHEPNTANPHVMGSGGGMY